LAAARAHDDRYQRNAAGSDAEQAARFFEKACRGGAVEGCDGALRGVLAGPSRSRPELSAPRAVKDAPARRRAVLAKACALDDRRRCEQAADAHLGFDRKKAEAFGRKACALDHADRGDRESCEQRRVALAERAEKGAEGCDAGRPGACKMLGDAIVHADCTRAREAYEKECKLRRLDEEGNTKRCVSLYEQAATAKKLPAAEPSIADRPHARVLLRSLSLDPSRPERPSPEQVREVVDKGTEPLRACYASALGRNSKLTGALTLSFTIDGLGHTWNVREQDLELVDVQAVECIKRAAGSWRFPKPNRDTIRVRASFVFRIERP